MIPVTRVLAFSCLSLFFVALATNVQSASFVAFESGSVRPLAMTSDGNKLLALNTPDSSLEIFTIGSDGLSLQASVPVGLEPVAVALNTDNEAWVVNHLSDSISVVALDNTPRVIRTLLVGDEPRDIVFAGVNQRRAFITTAHRGQHRNHASIAAVDGAGDPQLTTPGVGRADVWVFNASDQGASLGGTPEKIMNFFADTPRALAVSQDHSRVFVAAFKSGNQTAVVSEGMVCNGFAAGPCNGDGLSSPNGLAAGQVPGGSPGPVQNVHGDPAPEVGLIVKFDDSSGEWRDELGRNWSNAVRFNLPDQDVFEFDADSLTEMASFSSVGTTLFNMVVHPISGDLYVSNTESPNEVRFEGPGTFADSTVQGRLSLSRISIVNDSGVTLRHLNKHINYDVTPAAAGVKAHSLATPLQMVISSDGATLYVAAFGSAKIGVFNTAALENDSFDPTNASANYISLSGGGPAGLVLDEQRQRIYVLTRFDNAVATIDLTAAPTNAEIQRLAMHNPEPVAVTAGRPFLYDAVLTSSNGEASCASCHIFGDNDALAWDLGNPDAEVKTNPIPINAKFLAQALSQASPTLNGSGIFEDLHPMKGPMTTQTLRGMKNSGAMHWRGDRAVGSFGTDPFDSRLSFLNFNEAFPGLVGNNSELTPTQMGLFADFALALTMPPNPVRALDNSLDNAQQAGFDFFTGTRRSDGSPIDFTAAQDGFRCEGCHRLDPAQGFFGTGGFASFENEEQILKIAQLRNMYDKVGMFGMPAVEFFNVGDNEYLGDQVRGTGFMHDGATDTLRRFFDATVFNELSTQFGDVGFRDNQDRDDMEQYMLAFDSDLAPIVGQQMTLHAASSASQQARVDLLLQRGAASFVSKILGGVVTEADIVAKGVVGGEYRGYLRQPNGDFMSDRSAEAVLTATALKNLAMNAGNQLTFTAVPPGSGQRMALDRDEDGVFDGDDFCPAFADPGQLDSDADGRGDACDNCLLHANVSQIDVNGDGFGNRCDADLNGDGVANFIDLGIFKSEYFQTGPLESDFSGDGVVNAIDLGILRQLFFAAPGPSALVP